MYQFSLWLQARLASSHVSILHHQSESTGYLKVSIKLVYVSCVCGRVRAPGW